jgi:predicted nucleic acid-binding protein
MTEAGAERLVIATFAERPDLLAKVFEPEIQSAVHRLNVYDAAYLELAHRRGVPLATRDNAASCSRFARCS